MSENEADNEGAAPDASTLAAERDDYLARWQRAAADYQNLKRRSAAEVEGAVRRSLESLLSGLLLVVDHLDLALSSPLESDDARALAEGVRLTRDQLLGTLRQEGVEPTPEGGTFDTRLHEAVATLERDDMQPGQVVDTLRRGYTWRGQVLRAAHVRVSRAAEQS
jgi:molecular chaperone GrpE